jgi:hypothetical protein
MNFATLQGLTIPEGVVTQITDASGRVLWVLGGGKVILEVEKITSDTYAGETTYTGEQFILLDIYPKPNGTVSVTYGGLTKTITDTSGAAEPNAQQVFFGTFNGVSDEVGTPASGTLTIEGMCMAFGCSTFQNGSKSTNIGHSKCITAVSEWGGVDRIAGNAFHGCSSLNFISLPNRIKTIGEDAFYGCSGINEVHISSIYAWLDIKFISSNSNPLCNGADLYIDGVATTSIVIPEGINILKNSAFYGSNISEISLPSSLTTIGSYALGGCDGLTITDLPSGLTTIGSYAFVGVAGLSLTELPSGLKNIGSAVFMDRTLNLTELPSGLTTIGDSAFRNCSGLHLTELPSGLTTIGDSAFRNCSGLHLTELPSGLTTIPSHAFYNSQGLNNLIIPEGVITIGESAFAQMGIGTHTFTIPTSITNIGKHAFNAGSVSSVDIVINILATTPPTIGEAIFSNSTIKKVNVPAGCGEVYKTAEGWSEYADYIVEAS